MTDTVGISPTTRLLADVHGLIAADLARIEMLKQTHVYADAVRSHITYTRAINDALRVIKEKHHA